MGDSDTKQPLADLVLGARGWLHEQWVDNYYPEDIPDEWRLGFYANEFNTLLVPWPQWNESIEALEEGLEDTDDDFHLYLELPDTVEALPVHLNEIADKVAGLVCINDEIAGWQEQPLMDIALFAVSQQEGALFLEGSEVGSDKQVELVLIDSAKIDDLVVMREQLELALHSAGSRLDFIFTDTSPTLEAMRNTVMIAELLGA